MLKIKDVLHVELFDDETPYGGISFHGETVKDFIGITDMLNGEDSIDKLNKALQECGIREI